MYPMNDIGAFIKAFDGCASANSGAPSLITAGGALDNVKITGQTVNRISGTAIAHSAVVATCHLSALGAAETLSLAHEYQTSADDSTWDTAVAIQASTAVSTAVGAANYRGVSQHDVNLRTLKQYVRFNVTPDLSRANTDTCLLFTVAMLGGWSQVPQ